MHCYSQMRFQRKKVNLAFWNFLFVYGHTTLNAPDLVWNPYTGNSLSPLYMGLPESLGSLCLNSCAPCSLTWALGWQCFHIIALLSGLRLTPPWPWESSCPWKLHLQIPTAPDLFWRTLWGVSYYTWKLLEITNSKVLKIRTVSNDSSQNPFLTHHLAESPCTFIS